MSDDRPPEVLSMAEVSELASQASEHTLHLERLMLAYHKSNGERLAAMEQQLTAMPDMVRSAVESAQAGVAAAMTDLAAAMRSWEAKINEHTTALTARNAIEQERTALLRSALAGVGAVLGHKHTLTLAWLLGVTIVLRTAGVEPGPLVADLLLRVMGQ